MKIKSKKAIFLIGFFLIATTAYTAETKKELEEEARKLEYVILKSEIRLKQIKEKIKQIEEEEKKEKEAKIDRDITETRAKLLELEHEKYLKEYNKREKIKPKDMAEVRDKKIEYYQARYDLEKESENKKEMQKWKQKLYDILVVQNKDGSWRDLKKERYQRK